MRTNSLAIAFVIGLLWQSSATAQEWAQKMFETTTHDFGVVARGGKAEFSFKFKNLYQETIHIAEARSSCGCTTPQIITERLESRQTGEILAKFNTRSFLGQKEATITVVIDEPYYAEVQLRVSGYIRSDVVFSPGEVAFNGIPRGEGSTTAVDISYAGREDWAIVDVRSSNKHLAVELAETHRGSGRVDYRMVVKLKPDAPAGVMRDEISIITNDSNLKSVPLVVEAKIQADLEVSPSLLSLGSLAPGESVTKKVLIKGAEPFVIKSAKSADPAIGVEFPADSKKMQFVPITFRADQAGRQISDTVKVETSLGEVEVRITGSVK